MGVLGHPVDQRRGQQQPLGLAGVVVEVEREFGHPGLRVAVRVLVHPGHDMTGGVGEERRVRRPRVDRGAVAVAASVERDGALELGEDGQTGLGQGAGGAIKRPPGHVGHAQRRGREHVAVHLAHPERRLVGIQGGQLPGGVVRRGVGDHDAVEVAGAAAGQGRQVHRLIGRRATRGDQGVRYALTGQRGLPGGGRGVGGPLSDQQDPQVHRGRPGRRGGGRRAACRGEPGGGQCRREKGAQPSRKSTPQCGHKNPRPSVKTISRPRRTVARAKGRTMCSRGHKTVRAPGWLQEFRPRGAS